MVTALFGSLVANWTVNFMKVCEHALVEQVNSSPDSGGQPGLKKMILFF